MTKSLKRILWTVAVIGSLLVAAGAFAFSFGKYEKVKVSGGVVSVPLAKLGDGKTHYFRFEDGGKEIDFLVVKASDGSYRAAFNACDVCFHAKKGYEQKGDMLVCQNCNRQFAINRIGPHEVGGCNPSYLPSQIRGNNLTFATASLKAGTRFF